MRWATSPDARHGCRASPFRVGQKRRERF
ncbi:hypothetical protein FGI04_01360 [Dickeya ananatis]|nr:hypothetical protein FGI04_01360 [Dickeya zeae]